MQTWDDILATAVVGTEQRELRFAAREDDLGSLLAQISNTDREGVLLSAASVVGLYRSAGVAPPADTQLLPEASEQDEASRANRASGQHLALMLEGEFREVLLEWLAATNSAHKRVPEEHLPALLDLGRDQWNLRSTIIPVLGKRGEWLAAQNPDWSYATQRDEKDVWETGERQDRELLIEHLRDVDPGRARELLTTTWSQESAPERVAFLGRFVPGLSSSDEPFLNEALHDRSADVRSVARRLLARLPSEYSRRLKELANQTLSFKKPLMGKARIEVAMPEDPIEWLKANDIEIDRPPRTAARSQGSKGWGLKEMISLIPIAYWVELWRKSPIEIIHAADESEWRESFVEGFVAAAQRHEDPDWIEALILYTSTDPKHTPLTDIAAALPDARLEALIFDSLKSVSAGLSDSHSALQFLMVHRRPWSDHLSRAVVKSVKKRINQGKDSIVDWQTKYALKQFARYVSPAMYDELSIGWPTESEAWPNWAKGVDAFQSLLAFRRDIHRAISEKE
ncbi:MAG TPA: DUF5691 domain-containing protein [Pyrinomonadaceae bacterium]|nr:DUF5691 domain-containing protein [Pyrinomonadaceae bacterium]